MHHVQHGLELGQIGEAARDRLAVHAAVGDGEAGGEPRRPCLHRLGQDPLHLRDLVGRGRALVGVGAHGEQAHRGVPDVGGEVEADAAALDRRQVFGEGGEVPGDARLQGGDVHVLDVLQRARDQIAVLGVGGRNGEAAVAGHDRRDPVETRRGERGVPEDLGVVVGVDVDEPRGDDALAGVERAVTLQVAAELGDAPVGDADVGAHSGRSAPVDDRTATDDELIHVTTPWGWFSPLGGRS